MDSGRRRREVPLRGRLLRGARLGHRLRCQRGQGLVEYGLILVLVAVVVVVALTSLGGPLKSIFDTVKNSLLP
jgi:pilus assembly protein Flp/PilA